MTYAFALAAPCLGALGGASLCFNSLMSVLGIIEFGSVLMGVQAVAFRLMPDYKNNVNKEKNSWKFLTANFLTNLIVWYCLIVSSLGTIPDCWSFWVFAYPLMVHIRVHPKTLSHQLHPPWLGCIGHILGFAIRDWCLSLHSNLINPAAEDCKILDSPVTSLCAFHFKLVVASFTPCFCFHPGSRKRHGSCKRGCNAFDETEGTVKKVVSHKLCEAKTISIYNGSQFDFNGSYAIQLCICMNIRVHGYKSYKMVAVIHAWSPSKTWPCLRLGICNQIQPWGWNLCRRVILLRLGGTIQWQVVFFGKLHWTSIIWIVELESWCARICWTINYQHLLTNSIVMSSSKMLEVWEHYYEVGFGQCVVGSLFNRKGMNALAIQLIIYAIWAHVAWWPHIGHPPDAKFLAVVGTECHDPAYKRTQRGSHTVCRVARFMMSISYVWLCERTRARSVLSARKKKRSWHFETVLEPSQIFCQNQSKLFKTLVQVDVIGFPGS